MASWTDRGAAAVRGGMAGQVRPARRGAWRVGVAAGFVCLVVAAVMVNLGLLEPSEVRLGDLTARSARTEPSTAMPAPPPGGRSPSGHDIPGPRPGDRYRPTAPAAVGQGGASGGLAGGEPAANAAHAIGDATGATPVVSSAVLPGAEGPVRTPGLSGAAAPASATGPVAVAGVASPLAVPAGPSPSASAWRAEEPARPATTKDQLDDGSDDRTSSAGTGAATGGSPHERSASTGGHDPDDDDGGDD